MAPMALAVPMAASPPTPAPMTYTVAGGTLPAAVTCPVNRRPKELAASTTARYPAMLAIEDSTSIDCARDRRGTASIASAVKCEDARSSTSSGLRPGASRETSIAPGFIRLRYSRGGVSRVVMMSARHTSSPTSRAPAAT